jgi:hypothetical protein
MINLINANVGRNISFSLLGKFSDPSAGNEWHILESNVDGYVSLMRVDRETNKPSKQVSYFRIDAITHFSLGTLTI